VSKPARFFLRHSVDVHMVVDEKALCLFACHTGNEWVKTKNKHISLSAPIAVSMI